MPGSSHLGVFCRTRSIVKVSLSDRFKFFWYFGKIIIMITFPQNEKKKKIEIHKHKTSCFCN